jgi:RNA polymerase sigma-70 factor, ECF subfamily
VQPTDRELVRRALEGSEHAARELVERYQRPVYSLVVRLVGDPGASEELAQDAFVKAFAHLASYDSRYKFSSWIFRIAHNTAIDYLRRPRVAVASLDAEESALDETRVLTASEASPLALAERNELAAILESAIRRLRPEYREVVLLRYQEEMSYEEIAEILGRPLGTVKSDLHRARAELAALVRASGLGKG